MLIYENSPQRLPWAIFVLNNVLSCIAQSVILDIGYAPYSQVLDVDS